METAISNPSSQRRDRHGGQSDPARRSRGRQAASGARRPPRAASCCRTRPRRSRSAAPIVAAGEGRRDDDGDRIPLDVKVGDQVLFAKYAGTEFKLDDEELLILSEKDILAIVRLARQPQHQQQRVLRCELTADR